MRNNFTTQFLPRLFSMSILLFMFMIVPTYATDWCQRSGGGVAPCYNNIIPNNWVRCGDFNGNPMWCPPVNKNTNDNSAKDKSKNTHKVYAGLSLGYVAYINGGLTADYADKTDSWVVPGSFKQSAFQTDKRSTPIQFSFGAEVINNLRIDLSHMLYSGISMPGLVKTATGGRSGQDGYYSFHLTGGEVSGNATMLNAYYNLDSLIGRFFGGILSLYIGAGIGLGTNEISDYEVFDAGAYFIDDGWTGSSNIHAFHSGGTTKNNMVYMFEVGGTSELFGSKRWLLDIFARWTGLGSVETKGDVMLTQTIWDLGSPVYDETLYYKKWQESGTLSILDVGARLRFLF